MKKMTWILATWMVGCMMVEAVIASTVASATSAQGVLDTQTGTRTARASEAITYSTQWSTPAVACTVSVEAPDGTVTVLREAQPPEFGMVSWRPDLSTSGLYTLTHTAGSETLTANFNVLPPIDLPEALDSDLTFTTGGDASWFGQTTTTYDGIDAVQSGAIGDSEATWMQTTVTGPGTLSFWWNVSSEDGYDYVQFMIDDVEVGKIGGMSTTWTQSTHRIPSGSHTLKWQYYKDNSRSVGSDCAWVDQVTWVMDPPPVTIEVQNVMIRSRWPFEKKVDISYDIVSSDANAQATVTFKGYDQTRNATPITLTTLTGDGASGQSVGVGSHSVVWDVGTDYPNFEAQSYTIEVSAEKATDTPSDGTSLYTVIDLSGGVDAESYPVTHLSAVPEGGWTVDHKTNKLVLRRIEAGTFMMGSLADELGRMNDWDNEDRHEVTLTKPYYIGVFEVTQKQWSLVMGTDPSSYKGDARPVECVSYNMIRGTGEGARWPASAGVDATSFMGKLRAKTGFDLDLPTEAQWEYACRAGTTTALNSGKNLTSTTSCSNMNEIGRYGYNNGYYGGIVDGEGGYASNHTTVGSYLPNAWELYDMHGNVREWSLDWYVGSLGTASVTDPVSVVSGSDRLLRGGVWDCFSQYCRSAFRYGSAPSDATSGFGLRLAMPVPPPPPTSLYTVIDLSGGVDAESYPVTHLSAVPEGGWTVDHKTNKLVLRRIEAGTFTMGSPANELGRYNDEDLHEVTLTKPYYMGVFEVTQKQWSLVMGTDPSSSKGDVRPVEQVSYNMIRGTVEGAKWPASSGVDRTSFMGKLRAKTSLDFDLPTEAQWEYACRASTTTALNSGENLTATDTCPNMDEVGRYWYNQSDGKGGYADHTTVGSYLPNAWGLYDMHGNVAEWSLDWYVGSLGITAVTDPVGATSGSYRLIRGGGWIGGALGCRSAYRYSITPSDPYYYLGLRLAFPIGLQSPSTPTYTIINLSEGANAETTAVQSNVIRIDTRTTQGGAIASGTVSLPTYQGAVTLNDTTLSAIWDTTAHVDGWYALEQGSASTQVLVLNEPTILAGRLTQDQAFATDSLTVIHGDVIIPSGKTLTLAAGAVLKFTSGAQLIVETGGLIDASGAYLTHFADDTLLGDTNYDGTETTPIEESWTSGQALSWVSFDVGYGEGTALPVRTYSADKTYGMLPVLSRANYRFNGWYSAVSGGTQVIASSVVPTGETTLYAYWTEFVATPTFTPVTGATFESTFVVTLTCATPDVQIYYTMDGSEPTVESIRYTNFIFLTATTTIKVRAFKSGMVDSNVATATYTHQPPVGSAIGARTVEGLRVTIIVMPPSGSFAYAVEESVAVGIAPVDFGSNGGKWDATNRRVKWGPFFDANPRVLSYTIEGSQGTYTLFGRVSVDGESTTIGGATSITISGSQYHPADTSNDWSLSVDECTAYAKAWKTGMHTHMNYATRSGYLWRSGETYVDTLSYVLQPDTDASRWIPAGSTPASLSATALSTGATLGLVREIRGTSVSLQATPKPQTENYALFEHIPVGLTPTAISHDGTWDSLHRQVKWGPFYDNVARTFTCTLEGDTGRYTLMGAMSEDGSPVSTTGDTHVILGNIATLPINTWLDHYADPINGDYNTAIMTPTGKTDIHGDPLLYWHEYLMGTDPEDKTDVFHAKITLVNGVPHVTYSPDLKGDRMYIKEGKATLTDPWTTPPPDNAQFFRVKVQLP